MQRRKEPWERLFQNSQPIYILIKRKWFFSLRCQVMNSFDDSRNLFHTADLRLLAARNQLLVWFIVLLDPPY